MTVRDPPGFTLHPFPEAIPSPIPTAPHSASGPYSQRLQTPSPTQNIGMYGVPPAAFFSPRNNHHFFSPSVARNLAVELSEGQWAGINQAHSSQIQTEGYQTHPLSSSIPTHHSRPNLNQVMLDLNQKMDLNRKPTEENHLCCANYSKEDQQEPKKRKQGEALDFAGPYFTPGEGSIKPRNARIRIKGNKNKEGKGNTGEAEEYQDQLSNKETEAQVACKKPPQSE
ncbi:unnamed protein product [Linum trigynum]|uniref:Uncharacterized protein n=1 Tax=Linum trigynum TaxID=586398 RepID=A0AAV2DUQ3_9ROSI